jgi:inversin
VVDEPDIEGRSAFIWAAGKGADEVIRVYLKHNVDIQQVDSHEGTGVSSQQSVVHHVTVIPLLSQQSVV